MRYRSSPPCRALLLLPRASPSHAPQDRKTSIWRQSYERPRLSHRHGHGQPETPDGGGVPPPLRSATSSWGATRLVEPYIHSGKGASPPHCGGGHRRQDWGDAGGDHLGRAHSPGTWASTAGPGPLYPLLADYKVLSIPGISSLSYFCARISQRLAEDVHIVSAHGRSCDCVGAVRSNGKDLPPHRRR